MDYRNKKAQQDIQKLDKALREVRGVSLNQPLESGMMGGAVQKNNLHPDIHGLSSFNDPATLTAGAGQNQFKLPSITRNTQFSQPPQRDQRDSVPISHILGNYSSNSQNINNLINGSAATTHHHLNVTLGEEQFYYTAKNDEKIANKILQNVVNQSSISSIKVKTNQNDYVGLMSKKNKIGSVEFVQTGFAIGSNAFKAQNSTEGQIDFKMMTIDPDINMKLEMDSRKGARDIKNKGQKQSNDQQRNKQDVSQANYQIDIKNAATIQQQQASFENYMTRVITSVQHRKKYPRLKSLFLSSQNKGMEQTQKKENNSLNQYALGNIDKGDYGGNSKNIYDQDSQLISQSILNSPQNFNDLIQANQNYEDQSAIVSQATGQTTQGPKSKHNRHQSIGLPLQSKNQSIGQKIQSTQVSLLGNKNIVQKEPKVTEQVAYLLKQIQKKGQIFIPLEQIKDPNSSLVYKENKFQNENNPSNVFFSKHGFVSLAKDSNQMTDFISNDQFIEDGVTNQILKEIPFFKKFQSLRLFMQWKTLMRKNAYERKRQKLSQNMIFARPVFSEKFKKLINEMNAISNLFLIEIQQNVVYGKKQPSTLEEKCKTVIDQNRLFMEAILTKVKDIMIELKNEILADDDRFEDAIKEAKVAEILKNKHLKNQAVVQFHQQKKKTEAINEQYRLKKLRHMQYDQLLFLVFKYWSTKIVNLLFDSKKSFCDIYSDLKNYPQFEVSICFGSDGKLDSDPTMEEHLQSFTKVFEEMEHVIFRNQFLQFFMHDMNDLFFGKPSKYTRSIFENMKEVKDMNDQYKRNHKQIFDQLNDEVYQCQAVIESYKHLQEIQSFCLPWTQGKKDRQISMEIGAYKETLKKMNEFDKMIADVPPGNTKKGTILIETNTLKKQLIEMPRQVKDSIRQNVQQTMEQETKTLKEELSKTTEILDQLPTSLNTYVEQVNTLKYIEHKSEDFENKFLTIENLQQECRKDGLTVSSHLLRAIDEVRKLYHGLPELQKRSQEQLAQNKETMEKIMSSSSNVLSKKIKAFEKKYVETYLHDESRLNDCGDTLEELFKRSKAIHEIRSKVILYREFLKLLYEKDENPKLKMEQNKLSCADDFETLQEIHKHTIRLWKILLYWKKRRQMCYNTPFLNLDTQMIIKSIHKVMKYLEEKLPQHEFVQRQSRNICKTIQKQVKDTNLIIEFVKDLRRQSLQNRHWMQIFDLIKAPHLKTQNTFTIVDLSEYHIRDYEDDIHQIIDHANTESKYETIFQSICEEWEKLDLKIIPFKDTQNSYIMVNTETLNQAIEENLNTLEVVQQSEFATHIQTDIITWIKKLKTMHQNLEVWIDAQRHWINLDIIYNSSLFSNVFGENTKKFIDTRLQFQRIMWSCYKNPKAIYNLLIDSRIKVFKELSVHFKVLQLKVHEFLEQKRLIFSRFFFLNDSQFLEFLTLANTSQDFSIYINTLFIGAQTLYIQPADQVKMQKYEEGDKQISEEEDSQSSDDNQGEKSEMNGLLSVENSKMGIIGVNDYQVLGMISQNKELFLFEKPVLIKNDDPNIKEVEGYEVSGTGTGNVEQWLIKVESSMKETIQKQMQYAVKSFATRALDEWILDYPQQIVITTINLILSNEINDILEQKQREREAADGSEDQDEGEREGSGAEVREGDQADQKDDTALLEKSKAQNEQAPESAGRESVEEVPQVNKKTLKGAAVLKLSPDEQKNKLHLELFGADFVPDGRFKKAIEQATEDIRQRKLQQQVQQTVGAAALATVKISKRNQKRPEYKDFVMEVLGQQSFYGIFLRVQFWINKIIRSFGEEKKTDWQDKSIDFSLTGIQKMIMKNVILYLLHQRDSIDKLVTLEISDKNDFQWQSRIKVMWNQAQGPFETEGPTIECGGWKQQLGAEYLGSQQRLPLSPLTDRYFVFMSSALREKSGVLFKCNNSHQHASDVFEEFAQQCHMAYKSFQCNQDMHVSQLMQVINGAAMAKFWIFFEHLDNLPLVNFQIILKEIQMVQQQYIIAELGDLDLLADGNIGNKPIHFSENKNGAKDNLIYQKEGAGKIINNTMKINEQSIPILSKVPSNKVIQKLVGAQRPSLGIFGSLSNQIIIKNNIIAENLNLQAQSAFRSISLAKPNMIYLIHMILKSEGYQCYKKLGDLIQNFLIDFTNNKNKNLFGEDANNFDLMDQTTERLVLRDVKIAIKFATLLRDQEWEGYLEKVFSRQQKKWKFELQLHEKSITEKQTELIILDGQKKLILKDKERIDFDTMKEGLRQILKSKFFNEWRVVKQLRLTQNKKLPQKLNESEAEKELEKLIVDTYNALRNVQVEQEEALEKLRLEAIEKSKQAPDPLGKQVRRTMTSKNMPKRKLTHASTVELTFASSRQKDEEAFQKIIDDSMNKVVHAMKLRERPKQIYNCLGVIEYMRKQKGIALVGPVCSGKTQILKIVSQTLKIAYDVIFRTSAINPQTFSKEEFYGPINAFESLTQKDQEEALKKKNIFQIVLDNYSHEKMQLSTEQRKNYIQSFLIDSDQIDMYFMDSLIQFLQKSNLREREYYDDFEFILHLSSQGQAHDTVIQNLPITLPNGNIVMLPSDLYFFFETEDISNASPLFLTHIGLVVTQDNDVEWQDLFFKNMMVYFTKHLSLSQDQPHQLNIQTYFEECWKEFLNPIIDILDKNDQIKQWPLWNLKSLVLQFFRILNSLTYRLQSACQQNLHNEDPMAFPIYEMKRDVIRSIIVCSFILSFGICLNTELQKIFEDTFSSFRKKFNMQINAQAVMRPTIFDIYFDVEKLSWEVIQEKLEYKLKLGYYPKMTTLLVPTPSIALSFFILEQLTNYMKFDNELDKNFRILGPQGTSKTVILNTFIQRQQDNLDSIIIPMSGYLSFEMLRKAVESKYVAKRKKKFSPQNEFKKILIVIDDIHLQSNLKLNILEYFRTWTQSNGYFDVGAGIFKQITDFSILMAQNSTYRIEKCQQPGRYPLKNRFLFYTNTQYIDEIPIEKFKPFIQHWLTSKMWSPNRLLKKYYIIITNGMMQLLERVKRSEPMQNSSFSSLSCFDLLAKFCTSLVQNTVISDDHLEIGLKGQREEDAIANVVLYEVFRNYSDRIMKPQDRLLFTQKAIDIFRHEFQMRDAKVEYVDQLIMGNFHEKQVTSYIKYVNFSDKKAKVKDIIIQKLSEKSNNHFLMSFLDTPNGIRDVFKLSRILFKEQQHLILCGSPSSQKYECLQIAAVLNDATILELNCPKFNEPMKFEESFKQALLTVVRLDNVNCFIVINDHQLRDPIYIDFVYNYLSYIGKDEECVLMNDEFKKKVIEIEVDIFMKNKDNFKYDKNKQPNHEVCFKKSVEKLMKYAHIVLIINELQTYYEWVSLFPGLESKCDVMFMEDLSSDGYKQVTKQFLERCKIDEDMEEEERTNLVSSMVYAKETVKAKIFENFYNADFLKNYSNEEYLNGQGIEYIYPNEKKNHFFLFDNGNFNTYDPILKQQNYNMRAEYLLTMKQKYIMFLEVFRFFYDFLSLNLSIRKNYYETFIAKTDQFNIFFDEINSKKKDLHGASNHINYKMTMIQDKMNRIHKSIQDKQVSIQKRSAEIQDLKLQLRNQMEEVDQVLEDKNQKLNNILEEVSKLNEKEITFINQATTEFSKQEIGLLNILAAILDKDDKSDFEREIHGSYFHDVSELKDVLDERRHYGFNVQCFRKLKEYITKSQGNEFQKPVIFKLIFSFLSELYRKLNVRNTMQQQFSQIAEIKSSIDSNHFSINYSERYIKERKNELIVLENKNKRVKERDNKLVKKIEVAEISHMRTQHIFGSVKEYGQKINQKLDNINSRLQAILGDCIILATSICFLGTFSQEERIQIRSEIAKHISEVESIACSKDWFLDAKNPNFRANSKMFKSILKEYGLRRIILPHQHSGIITESVLCESLFHIIFAPSCPLVVDPTGEIQEFIRNKMISKLHIKQIYGSDLSINSQIQNTLKSHNGFALLNDVNSFEKASFGLCQDQSLLHRICESFYNGIDFNYDRSSIWKKVPGIEQNIFSSYNSLNKKMPVNEPDVENVSLYQIQLFSPSFDYQNGNLFMAKGSSFVAMSTNEEILTNTVGQNAWMEIKELLIEQINNHEWKQLQEIKDQIKFYDENKSHLNKAYENNFLVANHDTLQKIEEYTNLKQSIEDIENQLEERILYKRMYQEMIHKYEILTYYSKVILNMYLSLKAISKIMNEITYSWKMFKQIIQQVLRQVIAGLAQEAVAKKLKVPQNSSTAQSKTKTLNEDFKPQVDIDLKFFQRNFIPKLHKTFVSSVRQESTAPLFNLILAVRISMLQEQVSIQESQFFLKQLLLLKDFQDWRKAEIDFVDMKSDIQRPRILQLKRDITRLYPDFGKQFVEQLENDLGQTFQYKKASLHIFKLFKDPKFKNLSLMQEICLGFLCPDHEFKCKLTQFVYEQLTEVFDFTEEYSRLHQFLSRASWKHPIALLSVNHVNMINTISSIAQHYGVGLDVIRTDIESDKIIAESRVGINTKLDKVVKQNLLDQTAICMQTKEQRYQRLQTMATNYLKTGNICSDSQACLSKLNIIQNSLRQQFDNPDKQISENQDEDSERIIERAARSGSWVLISTIRFPQFWKRVCNKLDQLRQDKQIDDQFRLIFDLQGYNQSDISDAFIFDHSVAFHMTEQNTEEFQGFDDIWSAILDERVLIKLAEKIDTLEEQIIIKQNAKEDETKSDIGT